MNVAQTNVAIAVNVTNVIVANVKNALAINATAVNVANATVANVVNAIAVNANVVQMIALANVTNATSVNVKNVLAIVVKINANAKNLKNAKKQNSFV